MIDISLLKSLVGSSFSIKDFYHMIRKSEFVFTGNRLDFFNLLKSYVDEYDRFPTYDFLDSFFETEKDNPAKELYETLKNPEIEVYSEQEILSYFDLQLMSTCKGKSLDASKSFESRLKLANTSEVPELLSDYSDRISVISKATRKDHSESEVLSGDDSVIKTRKEYEEVERTGLSIGNYNIPEWDRVTGGLKKDDFIVLAAFAGQGKSTLLRWLMYQFLVSGLNVFFHTFEMSKKTIKNHFYCLHANNRKRFGCQFSNITYRKIKTATLTPDEKNFYLNEVVPDLNNNSNYGILTISQSGVGYTWEDCCAEVKSHIKSVCPVEVYGVDYMTLMKPKRGGRLERDDFNNMISSMRLFGLENNLAIVTPHQTSRGFYEEALKDKENRYSLSCLSDYHEMERSSTLVASMIRTEEMKKSASCQIQCLKHREDEPFNMFKLILDAPTGWFYAVPDIGSEASSEEERKGAIIDFLSTL